MEKSKVNGKAVASLSLGILSILIPVLGVLLGIVGIVFSKKAQSEIKLSNEDGRVLAISGMICSIVGLVIQLFFVFLILLGVLSFYSYS